MWKNVHCAALWCLSTLVALSALVPCEAQACQPEPPSVEWISLQTIASDIPTNAGIYVMRRGNITEQEPVFTHTLTGPDGPVALKQEGEGQFIRLVPEKPFKPNAQYTFSAICSSESCYSGPGEKKAVLTTGAGELLKPLPYAGASSVRATRVSPYKAQHMCEGSHDGYFRLTIAGPKAAHAAYYQVYREENPKTVAARWPNPSGTVRASLSSAGKQKCYYLRAVDHTGNVDENMTKACVVLPGATAQEPTLDGNIEPDAGPDTTGTDTTPGADNGGNIDSSINVRVGCGCAQSSDGVPASAGFLFLLALLAGGRYKLRLHHQK